MAAWVAILISVFGTAITVATIIHMHGRSQGATSEWMKGHETLDASRFAAVHADITEMKKDVKELLQR
jgi:hypothetical protein